MRGLDPRIHLLRNEVFREMDGRVKPGYDEFLNYAATRFPLRA